jgi:methylated-DNA-[protein]-cysteine S-methyltransferase
MIKYAIVPTSWGEILLAGSSRGLCGLALPPARKCDPHRRAKKIWNGCTHAGSLLQDLQKHIAQYFEGEPIDFNASVDLTELSDFQRKVLTAAKQLKYGQTITYGNLGKSIGQVNAVRAVAQALGQNPIPLVIPCHRVVASDGIGGFSAEQGIKLKQRMLDLEASVVGATA